MNRLRRIVPSSARISTVFFYRKPYETVIRIIRLSDY